MKKKTNVAILMLVIGIMHCAFAAEDHGKIAGKQVNITGRLSCTFCKLANPEKICASECCANCVKAGDPPMLTDAKGDTYLLLTGEKEVPLMTAERMRMIGGQVAVKGIFVSMGGIKAIYVDSMEKPAAKQVTVTGKLSCTFCKLAHPDKTCTPECCANCVKAGDPPLLTDAKGNMYILITGEKEVPLMNAERMKMMGGAVTVKGLVVNQSGMEAIFVDSMEKAKDM